MSQNESESNTQTVAREGSTNKVGQACIALFVVFVVALFAFGKAPLGVVAGKGGSSVNFDMLSSVGVLGGVFAVFFLPFRLPAILRLAPVKKVLGLIGGSGLIVHSVIAILMPLSYGSLHAPAGTGGIPPMARSGAEQWVIDGQVYRIESTYCLRLPKGLQYTIDYPWKFDPSEGPMNDARALEIAFPLMKHAYQKGLYKRTRITKLGHGKVLPTRIGVSLFERRGDKVSGYRVALSINDIIWRIQHEQVTTRIAGG